MKKQNLFMLLAGLSLCLAVGSARAQAIMPFGDSVTSRGGAPESTYRYWLWTYLQNAGFTGVTFVGSQWGASDGTPANYWPQQSYEGGDGLTSGSGLYDYESDAVNRNPDIVLLDLGSNDLNEGQDIKTNLLETQANLEAIIQGFYQANPSVVILLAVPTRWITSDPIEKRWMADLGRADAKAAHNQKKLGVYIRLVNLRGGFSPKSDTKDGTHPNVKGEKKIAKKYFNALRPILKKMQRARL